MSDSDHVVIDQDTMPEPRLDWHAGDRTGPKKHWHMRLNRPLTDEEFSAVRENGDACWDEEEDNFSMLQTLHFIEKAAPDVEVVAWWHSNYNVYVRGLYIPAKVYVIEGAMSAKDAIEAAKKTWKEQYGHHGVKATIKDTRLATKKDMRKMQEIK